VRLPFRAVGTECILEAGEMQIENGESMRTTLDIDRALLERAKSALGASTYTEAIERSLSRAVEQAEVDALLDSLRGEDLVWSLDDLRAWRQASRGDAS
jgi:Arc/MetJ family transcription regulator